jgi:small basic protein (TIGR04137 family)
VQTGHSLSEKLCRECTRLQISSFRALLFKSPQNYPSLLASDLGCFSGDLIQILRPMSQHPSLKGKGAIKAKRSVLKRFERVEVLKKRGQFKEGQRVIGLPKTKPED